MLAPRRPQQCDRAGRAWPSAITAFNFLNTLRENRGIAIVCDAIDSRREGNPAALRLEDVKTLGKTRARFLMRTPSRYIPTAFAPAGALLRKALVKLQLFRARCVFRSAGVRQVNRSSTILPKNKRKKSKAWGRPAAHAWAIDVVRLS